MKTLITLLIISGMQAASITLANQTVNDQIDVTQLVGLWQAGSPELGAGLTDNFRFYKDGKFAFSYNGEEDTRVIQGLKGTYRVAGQFIYFTIKYRMVTDGGEIVTGALGTNVNIFVFGDVGKVKAVAEKNPKELDRIHIREIKMTGNKITSLKFNNQLFSKISEDPDKYSN